MAQSTRKDKERQNRIIAGALTLLIALMLLLFLFFGGLTWDRDALAKSSTPEIMDDEPIFLEPELFDAGEENAFANDKPAPSLKGEPDYDPVENTEIVEPGVNPKPTPPTPKLVTSEKPQEVKAPEPTLSEKERQAATSAVAAKFSSKNGNSEGSDAGLSGAGGSGAGVTGKAGGRSFISCPKPDVTLRNKTIVTVNVVIDAEGNVTEAKATGSAAASIRQKCEAAALRAKWSAKKGATATRGTITFTITPR